jgi:predicted flap endonuclease-1-like 5' DNA nuclease
MDLSTFLIRILPCLIASAIAGAILGWFLKKLFCGKRIEELEASLSGRDSELAGVRASMGKVQGAADAENARDDAEIASLKGKVSSLEADLRACNERNASLDADVKAKAASLAAIPAAAAATSASSGVSEEAHAKLQADFEKLKLQYGELEGEKVFLLDRVKKAESGETLTRKLPESEWDDLELINGIGPVLERMLYDMGIYTFREIAGWDSAKIAEINEKLPQFKGRIEREGWVESAREEHFKKYGERL